MTASKSLRKCISANNNELVIYGADSFSQFPRRGASVHSKCDRALAAACPDDLVILRTSLDHDYYDWLRSCGLGSIHVIEYNALSKDRSLTELIIEDPGPVLKVIKYLGRKPVYTPWFSGSLEKKAAKILGAEHFGTSQAVAQKYNDKGTFKTICQQLEIPVVAGETFTLHPENAENCHEMIAIIRRYLVSNKSVIIRGTLAESAYSLYKTTGVDLEDLYHEIANSGESQVLIEPFLGVTSTPNDQWAIGRNGSINHLGILDQVCEQGLVWVGNIKGQQLDSNIYDYIHTTSHLIVTDMAKSGYCGVIGIDYIICEDGVFPVENNARFNGSSYVSMAVNNIEQLTATPVPFWKFIKTATSPCSFPELADRLAKHLYDGSTLNSVLPLNCKELSITGSFNIVIMAENLHLINDIEQSLVAIKVKKS